VGVFAKVNTGRLAGFMHPCPTQELNRCGDAVVDVVVGVVASLLDHGGDDVMCLLTVRAYRTIVDDFTPLYVMSLHPHASNRLDSCDENTKSGPAPARSGSSRCPPANKRSRPFASLALIGGGGDKKVANEQKQLFYSSYEEAARQNTREIGDMR
jgi:hypothetical protein